MKTFYFNIQSKGGAGKSMLTYFQALKNEDNPGSFFVDMDSSTQTSSRQLKFLTEKKRVGEISLLNSLRKIERDKMVAVLEQLAATDYAEIYLDLGAPESEQLPSLFSLDYSPEELKQLETELRAKFVFNVIVAGGAAYVSSFQYLKSLSSLLGEYFPIDVYINQFTFYNHEHLINEVKEFAETIGGPNLTLKYFGDLHPDRYSTQQIIEGVMAGVGLAAYKSFSSRTIIKREIAKI